ncbi:AraC family transcriptional regulator [Clostridium grantii]|uniref:AraC-type DNA-binding protein n=1 Tax=Clostridium grantii DSM 8605 TaxID=1121316 RepID=A0A1M5T3S2_9CLOT|nr:AraC family transcriptional regulator [Clostridium grantii]SHH45391.1 AraC-type DNA-binding protein [Clostridium grantii DSM 8605]
MEPYLEKPLKKGNFQVRVSNSNFKGNFPKHWHSEMEIVHVNEGSIIITLNQEEYLLKKGDILIIGSNKIHSYQELYCENRIDMILFNYSILEELNKDYDSFKNLLPILQNNHLIKSEENPHIHKRLESQIRTLVEEFNNKEIGYKYIIMARLYEFVTILLRTLPKENYTVEEIKKIQKKTELLTKVNDYIHRNFMNEITLNQIANEVNYSTFYFTRVFKEYTGVGFKKYLIYYRLNKAREFLLEEDKTIVNVAYESGFNSIKTFNRVFKDYIGCNPTEYKRTIFEK